MSDYIVALHEPPIALKTNPQNQYPIPYIDLAIELGKIWPNTIIRAMDDYIAWGRYKEDYEGESTDNGPFFIEYRGMKRILEFLQVLRKLIPDEQAIFFWHMSMGHTLKITSELTVDDLYNYDSIDG